MLEPTDAITNEVLEPITFVLAYPNVLHSVLCLDSNQSVHVNKPFQICPPLSFLTFLAH